MHQPPQPPSHHCLAPVRAVAQVSKASPSWKAYVDYVSDIVLAGFSAAILASTRYLLAQMDPEMMAKQVGVGMVAAECALVCSGGEGSWRVVQLVGRPHYGGTMRLLN